MKRTIDHGGVIAAAVGVALIIAAGIVYLLLQPAPAEVGPSFPLTTRSGEVIMPEDLDRP